MKRPSPFQPSIFDPEQGEALKEAGMDLAADNRAGILLFAQQLAIDAALSRPDRSAFIDDCHASEYGELALGNAAGSIFRGKAWQATGERRKSRRSSNHAHESKVWRYIADVQ
jgi:hypothetical protein